MAVSLNKFSKNCKLFKCSTLFKLKSTNQKDLSFNLWICNLTQQLFNIRAEYNSHTEFDFKPGFEIQGMKLLVRLFEYFQLVHQE